MKKISIIILILFIFIIFGIIIYSIILKTISVKKFISITRDVSFTVPSSIKMDIYKSNTEINNKAIVLVHGGGGVKRSKSSPREVEVANDLAKKGFIVGVPDYKLGKNSYPDSLYNIINAVQYIRKEYNITHISIMGLSFGATLACLEGLLSWICLPEEYKLYKDDKGVEIPANVINVISFYGIMNPLSRTYIEEKKSATSGITHTPGSFRPGHLPEVLGISRCVSCKDKESSYGKVEGVCDEEDRKLHCVAKRWLDISPVYYLTMGVLPSDYILPNFIIVHGERDTIVNKEQADEMIMALKRKSVSHSFIRVKNGKHGFSFSKNNDETSLDEWLLDKILMVLK